MPAEWQLQAPLRPVLGRGLLTAIPVGIAVLVELEIETAAAGAIATGAVLAGMIAFEAPARIRFAWQLATAPVIGAAAALGLLTAEPGWLAAVTMILFATASGLTVAVTPRFAVAGMIAVLALLLSQGFSQPASDAPEGLLLGAAGVLFQALFSLLTGIRHGDPPDPAPQPRLRAALATIGTAALDLDSPTVRHALRWGVALGIGTAAYHLVDLGTHGYWIPLTALFVLRPTQDETVTRIAMRAAGTLAGLLLATLLAALIGDHAIPLAIVLTVALAFAYPLLGIEYALFTMAITIFIVLLAFGLGEAASEAVDQRALGTAIGIAIAAAALLIWEPPLPRRRQSGGRAEV